MDDRGFPGYFLKPDWAAMWEKGIRDAWADDMVRRHGSMEAWWDEYACTYEDEEMKYSKRAGLVDRFLDVKPDTVLDVGGGTGVFAIPLARLVRRVVVLEPSKGMLEVLERKAGDEGIGNITCIRSTWEDVSKEELLERNGGKPYDAVLTSHAVYYIRDLHRSFQKMAEVAARHVYILIGCNGYKHDRDYERIYIQLHGKSLPPHPDYSFLYMVLRELGIEPDIEMVETSGRKPVESLDEMVEVWVRHLGGPKLTGEQDEALRTYLNRNITEEEGQLYYSYRSRDALIHWRTDGQEVHA